MGKKRLFTGLQSSGDLHLGNYLGALKPFVELSSDYDSMLMVADYHALTSLRDPKKLQENIFNTVVDYVAAGVDPKKAIIFKQSDVAAHTELAWIFECLVTVPFLMLAHAYKDKISKGLEANAGLFNYPMLMAADILLYDADIVPVGQDQRQHVEYAREAASKFNAEYGFTFKEPQEKINTDVGTILGTDGKKMSKSYGNTIPLFGTDSEIHAAVMAIVTDSTPVGQPLDTKTDTIFSLHRYFSDNLIELEKRYKEGTIGYKESKEILFENIRKTIRPMREVRSSLTRADVYQILEHGAGVAKQEAEQKMKEVRKKIGVILQ